ncbi:acylase [Synechocystis sp. LKSZ1]|uniref:acylase n=1 Tax=Synechocystis sp. LKSZ1 TaxID=3144951 RepID=UPI00336BF80F
MLKRIGLGLLACVLCLTLGWGVPSWGRNGPEILWDRWGIPHIFASDQESLLRAFGWAQAQGHGDLLLQLYGEARGRASEYGGIDYLATDQYVQMMAIPERAQAWYDQQTPTMRANLTAFAAGINQYFQQYPQAVTPAHRQVLPVSGVDVLAHVQRVLYFQFLTNPQQIEAVRNHQPIPVSPGGSNAWAIAPSRSRSGHALLLANPHLPWGGLYRWTEAQLQAPGLNLSGVTLVGMPVLAMGFNDNLGWSLTVNYPHNVNFYELTVQDGGYLWQGQIQTFGRERKTLKIRQADGSFQALEWEIQHSEAGVVLSQQGDRAYVLQMAGLDRPQVLEQFWQMGQASSFSDFEAALKTLQLPMFNLLYGDREGNIFYLYNALAPERTGTWQEWGQIRPARGPQDLWQGYFAYPNLPKLKNPHTGWLQNSNDPPWTSTWPSQLKPTDYPASLAAANLGLAPEIFRSQRSLKLLQTAEKLSLEQMIQQSLDSRLELADRVLPLLIPSAKALANPIGIEAAQVLERWDRQNNADSRGAVLFLLWALTLGPERIFSRPWNPQDPLNTPAGLADLNTALAVLEGVAAQMQLLYGSLDVAWGEVVTMTAGKSTRPAQGGPGNLGSFRVLELRAKADQRFQAIAGTSYLSGVEFSNPVQAQSILVYGNASQSQSPHNGDQLLLYSQNQLRPVWRTREAIQAHLEKQEQLP